MIAAVKIKSLEFRREREASWRELDELLARIERKGLRSLGAAELGRLPLLYRSALSSLAVARTISLDTTLVGYLEALAARAHLAVYATKEPFLVAMWGFFARGFPRAVRAALRPMLLSALFMVLGTVTSAALVTQDQDRFYSFVSPEYAQGRGPSASTAELRAVLYHGDDTSAGALTGFAGFLFTHNARIGMLAFAVGFILGVPTLMLMFMNGLILGAFVALYHSRGLGLDIWAWLLPHGVTELGAVVLCGGAGLVLARSIVFPGVHARVVGLGLAGRQAGLIVMGAVCMLLVAGLIEGIFRQVVQSVPIRLAVASTSFVLWAAYFSLAGRGGAAMKAVRSYDARERFLARRDRGQRLEIVTPEGVALGWVVATAGDRISAFLLDLLIMFVVSLAVMMAGYYGGGAGSDWYGLVLVIFLFLVLNFYFAFFEVRGRGQTPGKRRVGIRVIDRHGGELTAGAVLARNFMRHLELFLPLAVLAAPEALWPGQPGWARGIAVVWVLVIALLPLWNPQRLRPGDLVAGTIVVLSPRALLAEDVGARQGTGYAFSREQLGVYGIYELQVLEGVLRDFDEGKSKPEALEVVCDKIRRKIGYPPGPVDVVRFLRDFYAAQRAWLEQKMLFGRRREDKYS